MKSHVRRAHVRKGRIVKGAVVKIHNMNVNMLRGMLKSKKTPKHIKAAWMKKLSPKDKKVIGI